MGLHHCPATSPERQGLSPSHPHELLSHGLTHRKESGKRLKVPLLNAVEFVLSLSVRWRKRANTCCSLTRMYSSTMACACSIFWNPTATNPSSRYGVTANSVQLVLLLVDSLALLPLLPCILPTPAFLARPYQSPYSLAMNATRTITFYLPFSVASLPKLNLQDTELNCSQVIPSGEHSKSRETKAMIEDWMMSCSCNRDTCLIGMISFGRFFIDL